MNQKTSKVEKEFYLRCSYLTLSVLFDKEPKNYLCNSLFQVSYYPSIIQPSIVLDVILIVVHRAVGTDEFHLH